MAGLCARYAAVGIDGRNTRQDVKVSPVVSLRSFSTLLAPSDDDRSSFLPTPSRRGEKPIPPAASLYPSGRSSISSLGVGSMPMLLFTLVGPQSYLWNLPCKSDTFAPTYTEYTSGYSSWVQALKSLFSREHIFSGKLDSVLPKIVSHIMSKP